MDPDLIRRVHGVEPPRRAPVSFRRCLRVGCAAAIAAAACCLVVYALALAGNWSLTPPGGGAVTPLTILLACLLAGLLAGAGGYVAARVTRRPEIWTAIVGGVLAVGSLVGPQPAALTAMNLIAGLWLVIFVSRAVRLGSHLPSQ